MVGDDVIDIESGGARLRLLMLDSLIDVRHPCIKNCSHNRSRKYVRISIVRMVARPQAEVNAGGRKFRRVSCPGPLPRIRMPARTGGSAIGATATRPERTSSAPKARAPKILNIKYRSWPPAPPRLLGWCAWRRLLDHTDRPKTG